MSNLRIAELDFDQIKQNLKNFLEDQNEFTDYDFEGSGLAVLLDILAYNTHYNAYLANMLVNESFLDSAVKRSSVVSLAKHLGYTPKSVTGATATVDITVNNPTGLPVSITLPRFTTFSSSINGTSLTFLNVEPYTTTPVDGEYIFNDVIIKEGVLLEFQYTAVTPGPAEKYEIPNTNVDISTLLVSVQESATDTTTTIYTRASSLLDLNGTSKVYFLEENPLGNYQIFFGDNIIGKKLAVGNIIKMQYLVSSGADGNVSGLISQSFAAGSSIAGSTDINIAVVSNSTGGTARETIDSIKFNAVRSNSARNRVVTKSDYESAIKAEYNDIEAVAVWGGEENEPPVYGKVFISLKPFQDFVVSDVVKNNIKTSLLRQRQVLTVIPEFVDPDYVHLTFDLLVKYDPNSTTKSTGDISNLVRNASTQYFSQNLQQFNQSFYYSKFIQAITSADPSIVSAQANLSIQKRITPILNNANSYLSDNSIKFNNSLSPGQFNTSRFFIVSNGITIPVRIKDLPNDMPPKLSGTGTLQLYNVNTNLVISNIGTINYGTGELTINAITPVAFPTGQFDIRLNGDVQDNSFDVIPLKNQIIVLDNSTESLAANRTQGFKITVTSI